jgi:hypothetical protein
MKDRANRWLVGVADFFGRPQSLSRFGPRGRVWWDVDDDEDVRDIYMAAVSMVRPGAREKGI